MKLKDCILDQRSDKAFFKKMEIDILQHRQLMYETNFSNLPKRYRNSCKKAGYFLPLRGY